MTADLIRLRERLAARVTAADPAVRAALRTVPDGAEGDHAPYDRLIAVLASGDESELVASGYGPDAVLLAADPAAQIRAWAAAGRPGPGNVHVDAYPRSGADQPPSAHMLVERPYTRFAVYHA